VVASANAVSGDLNADGSTSLSSLEGDTITITLPGTSPNIADVEDGSGNTDIGIIAVDVQASNGVIHVLNKVLIPDTTN
jgi:transforming growth factor-beta-induced protein